MLNSSKRLAYYVFAFLDFFFFNFFFFALLAFLAAFASLRVGAGVVACSG